jgi:hypothetical protein
MPKEKEKPVAVKQMLAERDYAEATAAVRYFAAPMRRRSIRAAVLLTVAAIAAASLPACAGHSSARNVILAVAIFFTAAAASVWFLQPGKEKRDAGRWFHSCPPAALPQTATVFSDHVVVESECEHITEYWTDFSVCVETERLIAAAGGRQRFLFLVKKEGLPPEEAEHLSNLMRYAFDGRWYRMMRRKGGK